MVRMFRFCLVLCLSGVLLNSCSKKVKEQEKYISFQDDFGRTIQVKENASRFLSLTPSITEILGLICPDSQIVGRTPFCNYPASVLNKTVVNNYPPDFEKIVQLKPDVLIVKEGFLNSDQLKKLESLNISVYMQKYKSIDDVYRNILSIGKLTGHNPRAQQVVDSLKNIEKELIASIPSPSKSTLVIISKEPLYVYGRKSYFDDVLKLAGLYNVLDENISGEFPVVDAEYMLNKDPEILLTVPSVFEAPDLFEINSGLKKLSAFQSKKYFIINEDLFSRPGPRIFDSVYELRKVVYEKK